MTCFLLQTARDICLIVKFVVNWDQFVKSLLGKSALHPQTQQKFIWLFVQQKRQTVSNGYWRKATEIGLTSITPILTQRSERKILKIERLEKIVQSAMKQSLRTYLPKINETTRLIEFLSRDFKGNKLIAHCEKGTKTLLKEVVNPRKNTLILIGPEGDFSEDEIEMALANGFEPIHLGDHRLRTETAALLACTLTNAVYETF